MLSSFYRHCWTNSE